MPVYFESSPVSVVSDGADYVYVFRQTGCGCARFGGLCRMSKDSPILLLGLERPAGQILIGAASHHVLAGIVAAFAEVFGPPVRDQAVRAARHRLPAIAETKCVVAG